MSASRRPTPVSGLAIALSFAVLPLAAMAGPGVWTTNGPHGGSIHDVVADPLVVDRLLAIGDGGVFRSNDGGVSWLRFEDGALANYPSALAMADNASVAYMASNSDDVYRSVGGGAWTPTAFAAPSSAYVFDLDVRRGDANSVALVTFEGPWLSADGGASWTSGGTGLPTTTPSLVPVVAAYGSGRLYLAYSEIPAGGTSPVYVSTDGGASWSATGAMPGSFYAAYVSRADIAVAPTDDNRVYLAAAGDLYYSGNGGGSWSTLAPPGLGEGSPTSIRVHPTDPTTIYVGFEKGFYRFSFSSTWTALDTGLSADGVRINRVVDVALAPGFPTDDRIWVASDPGGLWRSDDAGASWATSHAGIESANVRSLAINPADSSRMWAGYGDGQGATAGLYRSTDGGMSWARANSGMTAVSVRALAIDPTTTVAGSERLMAVGSSRDWMGTYDSGIYASSDGASTWSVRTVPDGDANGDTGLQRSVVFDPRSCASPPASGPCTSGPLQTVYAAGSGRADATAYTSARIHKSTDGGVTWAPSDTGLPGVFGTFPCRVTQQAIPLVVDPVTPTTLYVGMFLSQFNETTCPAPTLDHGVFRSTDGGATWSHRGNGLPRWSGPGTSHYDVLALAVDPATPSTLYAAVARNLADSRVFKSTDSGATWFETSVGIAGSDVRALLVDPVDTDVVYAASGGNAASPGGVYRSDDGALSWNSISIGLPADSATALALDPADRTRLLAGTRASVWEITQLPDPDMDGAPTSVENAAPNGGDGDGNGTADAAEADVASFAGENGLPVGSLAAKGIALSQVTLALAAVQGNCTRINNAHALDARTLPNDIARGVAATHFGGTGVLRFEIPDCSEALVDVTVHGADFSDVDWTWRNFGPLVPGDAATMAWYGYGDAARLDADTWRIRLRAGELGSYRADTDTILFVGAPGFVDIQVFGDDFED